MPSILQKSKAVIPSQESPIRGAKNFVPKAMVVAVGQPPSEALASMHPRHRRRLECRQACMASESTLIRTAVRCV